MTSDSVQSDAGLRPQLIRGSDAARFLALGERKLWELTRSGEIPCLRIGKSLRYDIDDLRDWIARKKDARRG